MPPRSSRRIEQGPTEPATPRKRSARYVVEIRDAAGAPLLFTSADWTDSERDMALLAVLRLVGMKSAAPATRQANKPRSGGTPIVTPRRKT